jgi:spondin-1
LSYCSVGEAEEEGENFAEAEALEGANGEGIGICRTTPWSPYSECSASCGIGVTMKTRTFIDPKGRKKCPHVSVGE